MKIVIDDKIPYIRHAIERITDNAVYISGSDITASDVADADALIVRTRTYCGRELLEGSSVKFIATATIGYDHLDTDYLDAAGITWTNCPGCNSGSVAQYIHSVLLLLNRDFGLPLDGSTTIGIVGCGHVGSKVRAVAERLGMKVLVCDPLLDEPSFVPMDVIERLADVITFHVPLASEGMYATRHLADEKFFSRLCRRPFVINTSRGAVVDNDALAMALNSGRIRQAVIDTWEHEPDISLSLLNNVYIGTPHIAGYSADGKVNASNMSVKAICSFFGLECPPQEVPPSLPEGFIYTGNMLELYNPLDDSNRLKSAPSEFENQRGNYPLRREYVS
ncbi:4-phosphoerythronate dehydrogenase [Xylanibacter muris]|uniref:Erythronate-4-phosphate dehydrogenase n=1 Tax=Xylanibacter muris TaxID=2736290 RepID=A0ABX2AJ59_9BACT|nr:4-phosphoerythronate dehydrogenase [Xylanibacter muris]NPD91014.1 4-phosphoerythronate dehydrogenase [Xylanibacter muris]